MRFRIAVAAIVFLGGGAGVVAGQAAAPVAPLALVHPSEALGPTATITLQDALNVRVERRPAAVGGLRTPGARPEDRVQARAGLLPSFSFTTQYIGNQANGVNPNGRFVSMDGVNMYRAWGVVKQEISPSVLTGTPLARARAAEAEAAAKLEIARRGLTVTVTRNYYALVVAQRKYATAQQSAGQAARFLEVAQQQQRLGQVANSDVIKGRIQNQQQVQAFREAALSLDTARLNLSVLLFPSFSENFAVIDDLSASPALPPFPDVNAMAGRSNPDLLAAQAALSAANQDVKIARFGLLPSVAIEANYGIEANAFALHSRIAAQPELGVLPNLGYAVTVNLTVPVWDWGSQLSRVHQGEAKAHAAQVSLSQAQRQLARESLRRIQ